MALVNKTTVNDIPFGSPAQSSVINSPINELESNIDTILDYINNNKVLGDNQDVDETANATGNILFYNATTGYYLDEPGFSLLGHTHAGEDITSGTVAAARIANLDADKITTGTFATARIPNLDAGKITTGTMAYARLPISSTQVSNWDATHTNVSNNSASWDSTASIVSSNSGNWDTAYDRSVTGVSGSGNGTITISRFGLTNVSADLSHTHGYADLPMTSTQAGQWDTAYDDSITAISSDASGGNGIVTLTVRNNVNLTEDLSHTHGYADLPMTSTQAGNWDTAYDRSVTGVSGSGNGTLTINRQGTNLSTDLSHTHGYADLPFTLTEWNTAYDQSVSSVSLSGSGNGSMTVSITLVDGSTRSNNTSTSHNHSADDLTSGHLPMGRARRANESNTGVLQYNAHTRSSGRLYGGTTNPSESSSTYRLNYDGPFWATEQVTPSDARLKDVIGTIEEPFDILNSINGMRFTWKETGKEDIGFIAQEVMEKLPEAVYGGEDGSMYGMSDRQVLAVVVECVKQLNSRF